jgi:hypothetical protein
MALYILERSDEREKDRSRVIVGRRENVRRERNQ